MVRLFSAIDLPAHVRTELDQRLAEVRAGTDELTWIPPERWHITLGFYGDREHADRRGAWFRRRAAALAPAHVRLRAAGQFPGVLWIGVNPRDRAQAALLNRLAGELAPDPAQATDLAFVPHVTIARWKRGKIGNEVAMNVVRALDGYRGQWWSTDEVVLFRSDSTPDGPVYTPLDRVPLASKRR
jgi:2'-5' RNA ligase